MSNKVLIFIGESQKFDLNEIDGILTSLPSWNTQRLGPGIGSVQQYLCAQGLSEMMVRISEDNETITIDGSPDDARAGLAMSVQSALSNPLRVTDMGYSFDLAISDYSSASELLAAMSG